VQLTDTNKRARLYNGNVGTIIAIDAETGEIRVRLDAPTGQQGRKVECTASAFTGFRHSYAGTIYKGKGKTLDHTYLYHTHQGRAKSR
jgi:ATP-dependent exoDNAse (exonuclease V) alpha subunit